MVTRRRWPTWAALLVVVLGGLATGCCRILRSTRNLACTSRARATEIDAKLREQNIARAEPTMRAAAQRRGAELLSHRVQRLGLIAICGAPTSGSCVDVIGLMAGEGVPEPGAADGRPLRLIGPDGTERFVIPIGHDTPTTARLARRGSRLFVLVPQVTLHKKRRRAQCECDRAPHIVSMSDFFDVGNAFVLDNVQDVQIERVEVPVTEDYIEWKCRAWLV